MCTALGLAIIIVLILGCGFSGYHFFKWIDSLENHPTDINWFLASLLGSFMLIFIVLILIFLGVACVGIYQVAPTVGCYVLGHI